MIFLMLPKYVFSPAYEFVFLKVFFPIKGELANVRLLLAMSSRSEVG